MLKNCTFAVLAGVGLSGFGLGCGAFPASQAPTGVAAEVASKAQEVALQIGGTNGFGGPYMLGFADHMAPHMGFHSGAYLADTNGELLVELTNESDFPCTFHLSYIRSLDGLEPQTELIEVEPGATVEVTIPCAEILALGSPTEVGAVAAEWPDGVVFDNRYCVPGFLNSDFACGGVYESILGPDVNDLDQDGDTEELIVVSSTMFGHMGPIGMGQHMWTGQPGFGGMMNGFGPFMMGYPVQSAGQ